MNVSSIGRTMYPMAAAYRATKFAVRAISEGCARSPRYQRIAASGDAFL